MCVCMIYSQPNEIKRLERLLKRDLILRQKRPNQYQKRSNSETKET